MNPCANSPRSLPTNPSGKEAKIFPCTLRLLTPALSSFGEEREKAGATFVVQGPQCANGSGNSLPTTPSGKEAKIFPCTPRLLTPALSSFGEEREKAGATFVVQGRNAR